jgi:ADP-ribose pyrophosphatase YjhB (NUDIX family)
MNHYSYCVNCGKSGHYNYQCKLPIISIGIIPFTLDNGEYKYLIIKRKDSLGYVDFMRGKYTLENISGIMGMLNEMTVAERNNLLTKTFDDLWYKLWNTPIGPKYRGEETTAKDRFNQIKTGVKINNEMYTLKSLIDNCSCIWEEPEWGFPKGRREINERDLQCGMRECMEETGYNDATINIIQNMIPYDELFIGSNYKGYKHRYYVGYIDINSKPDKPYQESEVSDMVWLSYDDIKKKIRPYNLEKLDILKKVNTVLTRYRICC